MSVNIPIPPTPLLIAIIAFVILTVILPTITYLCKRNERKAEWRYGDNAILHFTGIISTIMLIATSAICCLEYNDNKLYYEMDEKWQNVYKELQRLDNHEQRQDYVDKYLLAEDKINQINVPENAYQYFVKSLRLRQDQVDKLKTAVKIKKVDQTGKAAESLLASP